MGKRLLVLHRDLTLIFFLATVLSCSKSGFKGKSSRGTPAEKHQGDQISADSDVSGGEDSSSEDIDSKQNDADGMDEKEPSDKSANDTELEDKLNSIDLTVGEVVVSKNIDIIWMYDDSGSMNRHKIPEKKTMLEAHIKDYADVKSFMTSDDWNVKTRGIQCFLNATGIKHSSACQENKDSLSDFYRPGSDHIVAIVSDRDTRYTVAQLQDDLKRYHDKITRSNDQTKFKLKLKVFAIAHPDVVPNDIHGEAKYLKELVKAFKGEIYDFDQDWSTHYKDFISYARQLKTNLKTGLDSNSEIVKVEFRGKVVSKDKYTFSNGDLEVKDGLLKAGETITVFYK